MPVQQHPPLMDDEDGDGEIACRFLTLGHEGVSFDGSALPDAFSGRLASQASAAASTQVQRLSSTAPESSSSTGSAGFAVAGTAQFGGVDAAGVTAGDA
jgi:hypothetical protein